MPALGRLRSAGWLCLLGGLLGGSCENSAYCVRGFHEGEVHEVSIVGPYDRNSADLGVPWDGMSGVGCTAFDLPIGSSFQVLVGKDVFHPACTTRTGEVSGLARVKVERQLLKTQAAAGGAVDFGTILVRVGEACLGKWAQVGLDVPANSGVLNTPPEPGQPRLLILRRGFAPLPESVDACMAEGAQLNSIGSCRDDFVVRVRRISP